MEVTNIWPPHPCQGHLQVQQVTCCPHPGDNLVMEIEPKYKYKAPHGPNDVGSPAAGLDGEVSTVHSSSTEHQFGWGRDNQGNLIWT